MNGDAEASEPWRLRVNTRVYLALVFLQRKPGASVVLRFQEHVNSV